MYSTRRWTTRWIIVASAIIVALGLAGCGGPAGGNGGSGGDGNLSQDDAQSFSTYAVQSADYQMSLFTSPGGMFPGLDSSGIEAAQDSCITESGSATDADGDGIPVSETYTYACTQATHGFDASGSVSLSDKNDADPNAGYDLVVDDWEFGMSSGSDSFTFSFDGTASAAASGSTYTADVDITFGLSSTSSGTTDSATFAYDFGQEFHSTASSGSDPFASGTLEFSGSISVDDGSDTYTLTAATNPSLAVEASCETGFQSGAAEFSDTAGNTLAVSYACSSATAMYNGTTITSAGL